jgi:hypothetical protein|tara:strand:+ start:1303 stop:1425 length:123 start_codon:yes stop_codon:yes gene_type:complete
MGQVWDPAKMSPLNSEAITLGNKKNQGHQACLQQKNTLEN